LKICTFAATQLNLNQGRSLLIVWSDNTRTKPLDVRDLGSAWKTREGIGVGTPLSELRKKLGNFKFRRRYIRINLKTKVFPTLKNKGEA